LISYETVSKDKEYNDLENFALNLWSLADMLAHLCGTFALSSFFFSGNPSLQQALSFIFGSASSFAIDVA